MNNPEVRIPLPEVGELCRSVLLGSGLGQAQTEAITRTIMAAEADDCRSHGLYRLLGYARAIRGGKVNIGAAPVVSKPGPAIVRVDACRGFAPLANDVGRPALIECARTLGVAVLAINNCYHFSALWVDLEPIAEAGLVAIAMTVGQSCVAPHGGGEAVFGTNPVAFAWPRPNQPPFIADFATSTVARGEIELRARAGKQIPPGWAIGPDRRATTDPAAALAGALLPFGGYKGTALALMVELMAGPLIGDLTSREAATEDGGAKNPPLGGEFIIAFDPVRFLGDGRAEHFARAENVFAAVADQDGARLPGDRRLAARARSGTEGVSVPKALMDELHTLILKNPV